jgi:hypothetical protein
MDNIAELTKESPTLKSKYDAATKGKVEEGNQQEYKEGDKGRETTKAGGRNRAKSSKAIPEEVRTPDVTAVFNMLGELSGEYMQEAKSTVIPLVQEEAKPMTNTEKGKLFAEKLRAAKLKNRGETYSSLPFLPQAVDAALEAAALVAENGGKLVDVINAAIESLRANSDYAGLTDSQKDNIEKDLRKEMAQYSDEVEESQKGSGQFKQSKTARDLAARLREDGKDDLADIVEAGQNYEVRKQNKVMSDALKIMAADPEAAYALAKENLLHPDIINTIFAQRLIDAEAEYAEDANDDTRKAYNEAKKDYQEYGTYQAQGLSIRGALAKIIPALKTQKIEDEFNNNIKNALGQDGNEKINNVARQAKKIRTGVFTDIANLVTGKDIDPSTILTKYSNPRIKKALDVLVSFGVHLNKNGAKGSGLTQLLALVAQDGKVAVDATREQVRELVTTNLRGINQALKENKMTDAQVDKAIDAFMETYEEIASYQMNRALARAYAEKNPSVSKSKNPAIVKEILYGALEGQDYQNKFAAKYGLPTLTPENIAKLKQLAENIAAVRDMGTFAMNNANNAFNNYVNSLKAKASNNPIKRYSKVFNYIAAYQFNNLLLRASILNKALISNIFQTLPKIIMQMARERSVSLGGSFRTIKTSIVDPVTNKTIDIELSPTADNMRLGALGLSKEGRSDIEADIMNQKSKVRRTLSKVFFVGSSRAFAIADAVTIPIATAIASRQAYGALLKDQYKKRGIDPSRQQISDDLNTILGRDATIIGAAFAKAVDEIRNGQLWKEAGFSKTDEFPQDPGLKGLATKEARIYAEAKIRMYELLAEGVTERLTQLYSDTEHGIFNKDIKPAEIIEQQKEIDRFIASTTREISFLGRPQGTPGELADGLNWIAKKVPFIKHTTLIPLFNNAVANGFSLFIKYEPILSTARSIKYKATGKRGLTESEKKQSYKLDFMKSMDQARLRESMYAAYAITAGLVAMLIKLRGGDDDDERRKKAAEGKGTFIATKEMEGRGLRDSSGDPIQGGYIYVNGEKIYNWMISPFYGAISASAILDNYDIFETLPAFATGGIRRPFIDDSEEVKSAIGMYAMNTLSGVMNYSSMTQQYRTLSDLMGLTQQTNKTSGERAGDLALNTIANMIQSFVPLSGLQKDVQNAYDAYNGNPQMLALDFYDKMAVNLAYVDGALRSNKTDCFGRPVEEELKAVGPFMGLDLFQFDKGELSLPFNRVYDKGEDKDKYMQMHTMHNFYPMVGNSTTIPITYAIEEGKDFASDLSYSTATGKGNGETISAEDIYGIEEQAAKSSRVKDKPKVKEIAPGVPESISYNLELTAEENNDANELMGKIVKNMFDEPGNMDTMYDMFANNEHYKNCMTSLYTIAKRVAIIEMIDEIKDQELYIKATKNLIDRWKNTYPDLTLPEKIEDISNY